jgi:hypothetical protein
MGRAVENFTDHNLHNVVIVYLQSKWVANDAKSISLIYVISSSIIWRYRYHTEYNREAKDYDQSNGSGIFFYKYGSDALNSKVLGIGVSV